MEGRGATNVCTDSDRSPRNLNSTAFFDPFSTYAYIKDFVMFHRLINSRTQLLFIYLFELILFSSGCPLRTRSTSWN
uniref:Uncharacterized protein n=1 Tax=Arundo donax TaxID=35708 RepID=A0A0A9EZ90_ARUDO